MCQERPTSLPPRLPLTLLRSLLGVVSFGASPASSRSVNPVRGARAVCSMRMPTGTQPHGECVRSVLPRRASTLAKMRERTSQPFTFETLWVGDDVYYERQVAFEDLRGIIESGQIATHTRYTVT